MEEERNKRRIKNAKTLEARYVHKKTKINVQIAEENAIKVEESTNKDNGENIVKIGQQTNKKPNVVGTFQLVVVKLPWYKKAWKSLIGFFGIY